MAGVDSHFVNNYGVWFDEFQELGLEHTMDKVWDGAVSYFEENGEVCMVVWCKLKYTNSAIHHIQEICDLCLVRATYKLLTGSCGFHNLCQKVRVDRKYGRVCRRSLRSHLLRECQAAGVKYKNSLVDDVQTSPCSTFNILHCKEGIQVTAK